MIDLSICIVSWKVKDLLKNCLSSMFNNQWKISFEVFVLDNNSGDGSADMVKQNFSQVKFIQNPSNEGFTKTNNRMIKESRGRYVLLLNPDTKIHPHSLDKMIEFMDNHPDCGAMGPKLLNSNGSLQKSCLGLPTLSALIVRNLFVEFLVPWNKVSKKYLMSDFSYNKEAEVDQPMGAALILRKETLNNVGLLDEKIIMFFDEVDLCYRIKKSGWKIFFYPGAEIMHYGGQSIKKWMPFKLSRMWNKSRDYFFKKHFGAFSLFLLWLSDLLRAAIIFGLILFTIYLIVTFYSIIF